MSEPPQNLRAPCAQCRRVTMQRVENVKIEFEPCCSNPAHNDFLEHAHIDTRCGACGTMNHLYRRYWPMTEPHFWYSEQPKMYAESGDEPWPIDLEWDDQA